MVIGGGVSDTRSMLLKALLRALKGEDRGTHWVRANGPNPGLAVQLHPAVKTASFPCNAFYERSRRYFSVLLKKVWNDALNDNCLDLAAQMSFYFVLSLFPFLLEVAATIGWLLSTNFWHNFAEWITNYLPHDARDTVFQTVLGLTRGYTGFFSIGLLGTVWAASTGFTTLMDSLNVAYEAKENRGFWKRRAIAVAATALSSLFLLASFGVLAFGHWAAATLSVDLKWIQAARAFFEITRWLVTLLLMCLGLDLINYFFPDVNRKWRWITPGRLFVALMFIGASFGFNVYATHVADYPKLYGALAGAIILLVWIYIGSFILLVGAEIDQAVEHLKAQGVAA